MNVNHDIILDRINSLETSLVSRMDAGSERMNTQDIFMTQQARRLEILESQEMTRVALVASRRTVRRALYELGLVLLAGALSAYGAYLAVQTDRPGPEMTAAPPPKAPTAIHSPYPPKDKGLPL